MKTISIRELHEKTGAWVRKASQHGEIIITDDGEPIAKLIPDRREKTPPYFARRKLSPAFRKLLAAGALARGRDVTTLISEDREDRAV